MKELEKFILEVMHLLAHRFKDRLVLKGGMQLRLLNSARYTQDVDYIFLSQESKKILVQSITTALSKSNRITIENTSLNSRGIFMDICVTDNSSLKAQLEISVVSDTDLIPAPMSTMNIALTHSIAGQVVNTLPLPMAFSHKIAAALERDVMRDLYDLYIFEGLTDFDHATLIKRLNKLCINRVKPIAIDYPEAANRLRQKTAVIDQLSVEKELLPLLLPGDYTGLALIIKSALIRLADKLVIKT